MNIVYVGNYRHPWCTEVHITRELEALGHDVLRFQEPPGGGDLETLRALEVVALRREAKLVMWQRTWGLPRDEATQLWRRLEANGIATASYHLDVYVGLARSRKLRGDPFWSTGTVFTPDGNHDSEMFFAMSGINHVWSPPAVVRDECSDVMPGRVRAEFDYDVVFVGSAARTYHGEWPWRGHLLDFLRREYGERFRHFGVTETVRGQDLNDLYATARVVVGDSCFARRDQWYWTDRPMETFGRGGCLVFPQIDKLAEMIGPYPSYTVGDFDGLRSTIRKLLVNPELRRATVESAQSRIVAAHTYRDRMQRALAVIEASR